MSAVAFAAEERTPRELRVTLDELSLMVGWRGGTCYRVALEPEQAIELAYRLTCAAVRADRAGRGALAELLELTAEPTTDA